MDIDVIINTGDYVAHIIGEIVTTSPQGNENTQLLAVIITNIPAILTATIAIITVIFASTREKRAQQFSFKKEFYIRQYDNMLELLAEYESAFNYLDCISKYEKLENSFGRFINEESEEMLNNAFSDIHKIDILRAKISLMINPNNPVSDALVKALDDASDSTNALIAFEAIFKASDSRGTTSEKLEDSATVNKESQKVSDDGASSSETDGIPQTPDDFVSIINIVRVMRSGLLSVAKTYLVAERNELLSNRRRCVK